MKRIDPEDTRIGMKYIRHWLNLQEGIGTELSGCCVHFSVLPLALSIGATAGQVDPG